MSTKAAATFDSGRRSRHTSSAASQVSSLDKTFSPLQSPGLDWNASCSTLHTTKTTASMLQFTPRFFARNLALVSSREQALFARPQATSTQMHVARPPSTPPASTPSTSSTTVSSTAPPQGLFINPATGQQVFYNHLLVRPAPSPLTMPAAARLRGGRPDDAASDDDAKPSASKPNSDDAAEPPAAGDEDAPVPPTRTPAPSSSTDALVLPMRPLPPPPLLPISCSRYPPPGAPGVAPPTGERARVRLRPPHQEFATPPNPTRIGAPIRAAPTIRRRP